MLRFIDTFGGILQMQKDVLASNIEVFDAWNVYMETYPNIKKHCITDSKGYDTKYDIEPVILRALTVDYNLLDIAHKNYLEQTRNITVKFNNLFNLNEEIEIYFYIGLCNGAGWATEINGKRTVLIGAEKIVELQWHEKTKIRSLISHELCHIAHSLIRKEPLYLADGDMTIKNIWKLYIEGFAERYGQKLNFDGVYSERGDEWTKWCKENYVNLCEVYLHRIENNLSTDDFYGDWNEYKGHSDLGYYIGCEFIRYIGEKKTVAELASLEVSVVRKLIINYLRGIVKGTIED